MTNTNTDTNVDSATTPVPTFASTGDDVVAGELRVMVGDKIVTVDTGGAVDIPRLMPHAFGAPPDAAARVLIVLTPGVERFEYFRLLARIQAGEATLTELAAAQDEYDNHFLDAPEWWRDRQSGRQA